MGNCKKCGRNEKWFGEPFRIVDKVLLCDTCIRIMILENTIDDLTQRLDDSKEDSAKLHATILNIQIVQLKTSETIEGILKTINNLAEFLKETIEGIRKIINSLADSIFIKLENY